MHDQGIQLFGERVYLLLKGFKYGLDGRMKGLGQDLQVFFLHGGHLQQFNWGRLPNIELQHEDPQLTQKQTELTIQDQPAPLWISFRSAAAGGVSHAKELHECRN